MSWIATAIIGTSVAGSILQRKQSKEAKKQAKADALEADKQARKAEAFAETEGEGVGALGQISLEVDDDEITDKVKSSSVRI
tara:strand:- start:26205 stop:26450 length:246 start_codon:yes stop_codon:yes gene_type:complete